MRRVLSMNIFCQGNNISACGMWLIVYDMVCSTNCKYKLAEYDISSPHIEKVVSSSNTSKLKLLKNHYPKLLGPIKKTQ